MLKECCNLTAAHSSSLWPHTCLSVHLISSQAFSLFPKVLLHCCPQTEADPAFLVSN